MTRVDLRKGPDSKDIQVDSSKKESDISLTYIPVWFSFDSFDKNGNGAFGSRPEICKRFIAMQTYVLIIVRDPHGYLSRRIRRADQSQRINHLDLKIAIAFFEGCDQGRGGFLGGG